MFNHERELSQLTDSLGLEPGLHVVTGLVISGKSLLLEKITKLFKKTHVPVELINLRNASFDSVNSLVYGLEDATNSWLKQFYKAMQHYKLDLEAYGFKAKLEIHPPPNATPLTRLSVLLAQIERSILPTHFGGAQKLRY